mgnify:CR=1 FL=1
MNPLEYILRHIEWSTKTFGPGRYTESILKHIAKELEEIRLLPIDLEEWVDVMILALDGAWRAGWSPTQIIQGLTEKQEKNIRRQWPAPVSEDEPIEHMKVS